MGSNTQLCVIIRKRFKPMCDQATQRLIILASCYKNEYNLTKIVWKILVAALLKNLLWSIVVVADGSRCGQMWRSLWCAARSCADVTPQLQQRQLGETVDMDMDKSWSGLGQWHRCTLHSSWLAGSSHLLNYGSDGSFSVCEGNYFAHNRDDITTFMN